MPIAPPPRRGFSAPLVSKDEADRRVRQAETSYKKQGYSDKGAEAEAEKDFQIAQMIRLRRFPKRGKLPGTPQ